MSEDVCAIARPWFSSTAHGCSKTCTMNSTHTGVGGLHAATATATSPGTRVITSRNIRLSSSTMTRFTLGAPWYQQELSQVTLAAEDEAMRTSQSAPFSLSPCDVSRLGMLISYFGCRRRIRVNATGSPRSCTGRDLLSGSSTRYRRC